ncbi:hypothetical protein TNCV_638031 [Trichonephila clavipes]|nr:hypothetical protein TNCV_638031 [Trichonephila clavipes]
MTVAREGCGSFAQPGLLMTEGGFVLGTLSSERRFNILKDNWGRWKQHSRALRGSFMARRKPRVLTLGQS